MKGKRFREEQIIGILKEADAGLAVAELIRKYAISEQTYYRWKSKFGGMELSDAKRLKQLEDENRRLKTAGGRAGLGHPDPQGGQRRESTDARRQTPGDCRRA